VPVKDVAHFVNCCNPAITMIAQTGAEI
jgi:hypothetical protein